MTIFDQSQLPDSERQLVAAAAQFAADHIAPNAAAWEAQRQQPRPALEAAMAAGFGGLLVPQDLGGQGLSFAGFVHLIRKLAAADMGFAFAVVVHNNLAAAIARRADPAQQQSCLPDLIAGRKIGAFLLTEPQGGSDAGAIQTQAVRDGDGWRLHGEKAWISNASHADLLGVYAQTDASQGWRGIASFLVPADLPGITRLPSYLMLGAHAIGAGGFCFDDVQLPADALYVPAGEGFKAAMEGIDLARIGVAAMCCAIAEAGLQITIERLQQRQAFGKPLAAFQGLQWQMADAKTELLAASLLTQQAIAAMLQQKDVTVMAAHAKKHATRMAFQVISACMQAAGADGFRHELPLARFLAQARMAQYLDGTTEIQNLVIARDLFGRV